MSLGQILFFYGRFLIPFSQIGFRLKGLRAPTVFPELAGRRLLVTGATGGIGAALALGGARGGAIVLAVGRSQPKLDALVAQAEGLPGRIVPLRADTSRVADTVALADRLAGEAPLDALVNNVGILNDRHEATPEGVEAMYAVNILNPYILTERLIASGRLAGGVVVNMASGGMYGVAQNLKYMEQPPPHNGGAAFDGTAAYGTHKRAQMVLSDWWGRPGSGLAACTMHPGWVDTEGVQRSLPQFRRVLRPLLRSPDQGADTALWLIARRPPMPPGAFWFDRAPRAAHAYGFTRKPRAGDEAIRAKLAEDAARLTAAQA